MKFKHNTRRRAEEYEKAISEWWKANKIFERSVEQRPADNAYVFYDGPPFITGNPHHGTLLSSVIKDIVPRYFTMRGKRVERVWGWDCHGLPAENFTEKHLNGTVSRKAGGKPDELILKSGDETKNINLEEYVKTARDLMVANSELWESYIDRIGRWVDFKGAYRTMDKSFMESVWWAFKSLYDKGLIYEGEKVLMYDTKFATPVSKAEVTMDNDAYQTVTDPSVFVKFRVKSSPKILVFLHGTTIMHATAKNVVREERVRQSERREVVVLDYENYIPIENSVIKLKNWQKQGAKIFYLSSHENAEDINKDKKVLDKFDFPHGDILWRHDGETYAEVAEKIQPDILVEDDCESIGGNNEMVITHISPEIRQKIKSITVKEFGGVDHLPDDVSSMVGGVTTYLLAWTTTPWTLPANMALAVNPKLKYVEAEVDGENLILAKDLVEKVLVDDKKQPLDYKIVREMSGKELVGTQYVPLFPEADGAVVSEKAHKVYAADYVEVDVGTGIIHLAPVYGEIDFEFAQEKGIPTKHVINDNGYYYHNVAEQLHQIGVQNTDETGIEVWAANKFIAKCLHETGTVWKIEYIRHEYPFNPRSKQRIMYRAIPSWFFDIQGQKPLMLAKNEDINWFPEHLKHGRFAKNIEQAPDWTLSRNRFWATAMPVWKGDKGSVLVIGSYDELKKYSGVELDDYHRPWVDKIEFDAWAWGTKEKHAILPLDDERMAKKDRSGPPYLAKEHFTRIEEVLDGWFESGSMPFAQFHYPFENKAKFEANYPADFITEYVGQVRAWFYYVHAVNTSLAEIGAFGEMKDAEEKK